MHCLFVIIFLSGYTYTWIKFKCIFVAKSEISKWPIINKLCKLGRTIFVDRNNFIKVKDQVKLISDRLDKGLSVILLRELQVMAPKFFLLKSSLMGIIESKGKKL